MRCIGIKGDVFHSAAVNAAGNLIETPEVPFKHQLTTACDQNGVHVSSAREPISHPAQCVAIDELIIVEGGDGPAVVSRSRKTAAVGRLRVHRQRRAWRQRSSPDQRNKLAPSHAILFGSHVLRAPNVSDAPTSLSKARGPNSTAHRTVAYVSLGSPMRCSGTQRHTPSDNLRGGRE